MTFTYTDDVPPGAECIYVSPSALSKTTCEQAFANQIVGLHATRKTEEMVLGQAIHAFTATQYTHDPLLAVAKAVSIYKDINDDTKIIQDICMSYPSSIVPAPLVLPRTVRNGDGVERIENHPCVEFGFEVPWLTFTLAGKTYCVVVCGIIDHLSFVQGFVRVFDWKSSKNYKLDEARAKYRHTSQFLFYLWAIWKFGCRFLPMELHNAARDLKMTSQLGLIQWKVKPPRWSLDSPDQPSTAVYEDFEVTLRSTLETVLPPALTSPRKNGWVADRCSWCEYADLCHATPGMETAVREGLYYTRKHTKIV